MTTIEYKGVTFTSTVFNVKVETRIMKNYSRSDCPRTATKNLKVVKIGQKLYVKIVNTTAVKAKARIIYF